MFVFDQFDSTLVQFFSRENDSQLIYLVGALMIINCITILVFQFPLLKIISNLCDRHKVYLGILFFAIAQIIFACTPTLLFVGWISTTIILTLGEIILFSTINLQIDKMAPRDLKGAYFGFSNLYSLGLCLAPVIGAILLAKFGRTILFLIMSIICIAIFLIYRRVLILYSKG
jgi:MFS family permease